LEALGGVLMDLSEGVGVEPFACFAVGAGIGIGHGQFMSRTPSLDLSEDLPARGVGAEGLGKKRPEAHRHRKAPTPLVRRGCELGRRDPGLEELGELTKRSASESLELSLEFFLG